jgi:broad specificity phosphatase PhoE
MLAVSWVAADEPEPGWTTVIVVRHAEKAEGGKDPVLSEAGQARAEALARQLIDLDIQAIHATQFRRTQQTAQPLADALDLEIGVDTIGRDLDDELRGIGERLLDERAGQAVLVVGHSNTVPMLIEALGAGDAPALTESDYDDLFVVTVSPAGEAALLHLHYGARSP